MGTSTLSAAWALRRHRSQQQILLKRFLNHHNISRSLSHQIQKYLDNIVSLREKKVSKEKVQYISYLSGPLEKDLHYELFLPHVSNHKMLKDYDVTNASAMKQLCLHALSLSNQPRMEMIFNCGEKAKCMYFVRDGHVLYHLRLGGVTAMLEAGHWCSEAVLWIEWEHLGDMKA